MTVKHLTIAVLLALCLTGRFAAADSALHPAKLDGVIPIEPDPAITPGASGPSVIDPRLTKAVLCDPTHHTKQDRDVTESDKVATYAAYGIVVPKVKKTMPNRKTKLVYNFHVGYCATKQGCEVDHLCSLENGCSNSPLNRWVEPYEGTIWSAHAKDIVENRLHKLMCAGKVELADDQNILSTDWISGWFKYVSPLPPTPAGTIDPKTPKGFGG